MEHLPELVYAALRQMQAFVAQLITAMPAHLVQVVLPKIALLMINVELLRERASAAHQH